MDKNNKILTKISNKIGITRKEVIIVSILVLGLLLGIIYKYFISSAQEDGVAVSEIIVKKLDSLDNMDTSKVLNNIANPIQIENIEAETTTNTEIINKLPKSKYVGIININTAPKTELMKLERVGPKIADAIIEYRQSKPFRRIEEIMYVKGIGDKTFEKIKKNIKVSN